LGGESASGTVPGVAAGSYPRPPGDDKRAYEHGIEGKLGATLMEVALPGPMGTAAGLTGDGIDCLKMGFDFVGGSRPGVWQADSGGVRPTAGCAAGGKRSRKPERYRQRSRPRKRGRPS
jgi:hypothetical protein